MTRSAWSRRLTALAQSVRCTETPRPRVTKPMISSPGTGVQQRDKRTMTSSSPPTCTPASARRLQAAVARKQASVDARTAAPVADLGVDRVREVGRRRARDERVHFALRREDEDLVLFEVDLQAVHELGRIVRLRLPVDDLLHPD